MARLVPATLAVLVALTFSAPEAWAQRKDDDKPGRQKADKADKKAADPKGGTKKDFNYDIKKNKKA